MTAGQIGWRIGEWQIEQTVSAKPEAPIRKSEPNLLVTHRPALPDEKRLAADIERMRERLEVCRSGTGWGRRSG